MEALAPHIKLWVEDNGRLLMSDYRLRLLELVDETGSLAQAATALSLSYRRAWGKLKELERNLGISLVRSAAGGPGGGRTELTSAGHELVVAFAAFRDRTEHDVQRAFEELLLPALVPPPATPAPDR